MRKRNLGSNFGVLTYLFCSAIMTAGSAGAVAATLPPGPLLMQLESDQGVVATAGSMTWEDQAPLGGVNSAGTSIADRVPAITLGATPASMPAISFDGDDFLNISANAAFDGNTKTWLAVVRTNTPAATQWVFGNSYASLDGGATNPDNFGTNHAWGTFIENSLYRQNARNSTGGIRNPSPVGHTADEGWFIITGIWNGDLIKTTIIDDAGDVVASATLSGASGNPVGHKLSRLGADPAGGGSGFNGQIAALLVYDTNLTAANEAAAQAYLFDKYLLSVPEPSGCALFGLASVAVLLTRNVRRRVRSR